MGSATPLINLPKLNFNLFVFIASLVAIGIGEKDGLYVLMGFGISGAVISIISLAVCLFQYTRHYVKVTKNLNKPTQQNDSKIHTIKTTK